MWLELTSDQEQIALGIPFGLSPELQSRKSRAIGVTTDCPSSTLPEVPISVGQGGLASESGVQGWVVRMASMHPPTSIVARLSDRVPAAGGTHACASCMTVSASRHSRSRPPSFRRNPPQFAHYVKLDSQRIAAHAGIPLGMPRPDPVVQDMQTLAVAPEQPRIQRLMHLGAAAQRRGLALDFAREVSPLIWDGTVDGWDRGEHLSQAARRAGLDLDELQAQADADPQSMEALIAENHRDHARSGHWGVPTFVFAGEPFFGQDRFDLLVWRLEQRGLERRVCSNQ